MSYYSTLVDKQAYICFTDLNLLLWVLISMDVKAQPGIQDVHFLPFNLPDKRTSLTYIDNEGKLHRSSKGAPKHVLFSECFTLFTRLGNGIC